MLNSTISTPGAQYACTDIDNVYLKTLLNLPEYMQMAIKLIPQAIIDQYGLIPKVLDSYVCMEIIRVIYGLPQTGILANKLLKKKLASHEYYEVQHMPELFKHQWRPIQTCRRRLYNKICGKGACRSHN